MGAVTGLGGGMGTQKVITPSGMQGLANDVGMGGTVGTVTGLEHQGAKGAVNTYNGMMGNNTAGGGGAGVGGSNGGGITGMGSSSNPAMANITNPISSQQMNTAQSNANNSLTNANLLLNTLTNQGGAGNQSNVYNQGNTLAGQLGNANGIGTQTGAIGGLQGVAGQQQATAQQLQNIANGQGPNPAQAMLNQATGQNVANQAALMAGQRGAGANVGLMAREAAQQGAATQQQAVGQGATMQAQQSLGALGQLTGQQQAMAGTQGQIGALGQGLTAQQQAQLAQNAGVAQNQVGNWLTSMGQNVSGNLQNAGQNLGAVGQYNTNLVSGQGSVNAGNTAMNVQAMAGRQGVANTLLSGASGIGATLGGSTGGGDTTTPTTTPMDTGPQNGSAVSAGANPAGTEATTAGPSINTAAYGGRIARYADGGVAPEGSSAPAATGMLPVLQQSPTGPQSAFGRYLAGLGTQQSNLPMPMAKGGVPTRGTLASAGGHVDAKTPAQKAVKAGNSYANDKVPALLSEGEVVLPRSVMQSKDPVRDAADFVRKVMAKRAS